MTDRAQIAADWAARGFSCDLWTDPPGQRWEDFTHATHEVVIVLEGEMEFEVVGTIVPSSARRGIADSGWCRTFGSERWQHDGALALRI